jgi:hypothetical protein
LSFLEVQVLAEPVSTVSLAGQAGGGGQGLAGSGVGQVGLGFHQVGQGGVGEQREQLRGGVAVQVLVAAGGVPGGDLGHVGRGRPGAGSGSSAGVSFLSFAGGRSGGELV